MMRRAEELPNYKIMGKLGTDWEVMDFVDTAASFAFKLSDMTSDPFWCALAQRIGSGV